MPRNNAYDLKPVIVLLRWEDGASDAAFAEELGEWVDVERLATYVALQDLLANTDLHHPEARLRCMRGRESESSTLLV